MAGRYTIWLVPPQKIKLILDKTISELAQKFDGPIMEPHITLLGDAGVTEAEMLKKAEMVAKATKPFTLELGEISYSTTYFQNVFIRVISNPNLMDAFINAKKYLMLLLEFICPISV